jgi:hypothetical protein
MKLIITWGLPASGKTTYTKESTKERGGYYNHRGPSLVSVSHDDFDIYGSKDKSDYFINRLSSLLNSDYDIIIADTLITTHEDFANFLKKFNLKKVTSIEVQYWRENREACLWNDRYRRSKNCEITIKNAKYEIPTTASIRELCPKTTDVIVVANDVIRKSSWQLFADKYSIRHTNGELKSETWSLGGTYGSCWSDTLNRVEGSAPLASFVEFDELLEKISPNITFLQYKRVYNNCVTTDTGSESDYYGGSTSYAYYKCNIEQLYNELDSLNLINLD